MKRRLVVGAHYGLNDWLIQRVTACIMLLYVPLMLLLLLIYPPVSYQAWMELMTFGPVVALNGIFFFALLYHAWIGVRDIWMDYIKPVWVRLILHVLTWCVLFIYAGWFVFLLWRL